MEFQLFLLWCSVYTIGTNGAKMRFTTITTFQITTAMKVNLFTAKLKVNERNDQKFFVDPITSWCCEQCHGAFFWFLLSFFVFFSDKQQNESNGKTHFLIFWVFHVFLDIHLLVCLVCGVNNEALLSLN